MGNQAFKKRDEHLPPCGASQPVSAYALTEGASGAIRGKKAMRAMLEWPDWDGGEIDPGLSIPLNPSPVLPGFNPGPRLATQAISPHLFLPDEFIQRDMFTRCGGLGSDSRS